MSKYEIPGTKNIHPEQVTGAYLDSEFFPKFNDMLDKFKQDVTTMDSLRVLRIGHAEFAFISKEISYVQGNKISPRHPRHFTGKQTKEDYDMAFKTINNVDYLTTQIGYDFKRWLCDIVNYKNRYMSALDKDELWNDKSKFTHGYEDISFHNLVDMPLEIIYGLIANKWLLETFKNQICLVGAAPKLDLIKTLMTNQTYRDYIKNDTFEYIPIPQKQAIEDRSYESNVLDLIFKSRSKLFLVGVGCAKLRLFNQFPNKGVFIDVGHGIDAIAGVCDATRPYFGNWTNYRLKEYDYRHIDLCGKPKIDVLL